MKFLRGGLMTGLSVAALAVSSPRGTAATPSAGVADGTPQLLTELTFNTAPIGAAGLSNLVLPGWHFSTVRGGSIGVEATESPISTGASVDALKGSYPVAGAGGQFILADYNVKSLRIEDVYIEFWAKMPDAKGGCKFAKVFGDRTDGYANTTIGTNYTGGDYGSVYQIGFGDGTTVLNDGQHDIALDGTDPRSIGRSYGTAKVSTPQNSAFTSVDWGKVWHHFRIHVKFNSGTTRQNEVPNGEVYLEIDGNVYVDATGLYNRNPVNGPIHHVEFFGWAQKDPVPFQLYYDDIRISTGGFLSQPIPEPPGNIGVQGTN